MAARENQGYLIAVIILVLLTLSLGLASFFGISKAAEYADDRAAAETRLIVQEKLARAESIKARVLEAIVGNFGVSVAEIQTLADSLDNLTIDPALDTNQKSQINEVVQAVKDIRAQYDRDMKQNIASEGDDSQEFTYTSLISNYAAVMADKHNEVNILRNDINRITNDAQKNIEAKQTEVAAMEERLTVKQNDFDKEQERSKKKLSETLAAMEDIKLANREVVDIAQTKRQAHTEEIKKLSGRIVMIEDENVTLKEKVDRYEREVFDLPDGKIVRATSQFVYLDLGSADGLRTNRTFSVYDQSVTNFEKGQHKAAIEITKILGPHQSEARITDNHYTDPILKGDYVLTPTWDPGSRVAFALVGFFDLDGDGRSDRERLVRMIEFNGGIVVAQHDENGSIAGKIDSSTRYLVKGNSPDPTSTSQAVYNAIDKLFAQAKKNSVQEIDTKKLFEWMGLRGRARIEKLDSTMGDQYRRRDPVDTLQGNKQDQDN